MAKLFFQYLALHNKDNLPNNLKQIAKVKSQFFEILY